MAEQPINFKGKDFASRDKEGRSAISRKGGSVRSAKKRTAALLRSLRRFDYTCADSVMKKVADMVNDPSVAQADLLLFAEEVRKDSADMSDGARVQLVNALSNVHRTIFGEKIKQMNINMDMNADDVAEKLLMRMFEDEEVQK